MKYGIPPDAFVFGMLCRLSHEKGVDNALRALARLNAKHPDRSFYLVVAGEGSELDMLKALADQLGVQNRVKFVGFVKTPAAMLSAYDVILFSSRVEGLPLGLLQGMAAGCIPIATRISGMPEAVHSPEVGWVVSPDDPAALSDAMNAVLTLDVQKRLEMRQRVIRRVQDSFDLAECNRRIVELCEIRSEGSRSLRQQSFVTS